jgi:hypothetical protein
MLSEIVTHIGVTRSPTHIYLVLFNPVFDPLEYHVHGFEALLLDCVINADICGGAISSKFYGVLCVAHFIKGCVCDSVFFSIDKNGTKFSLSH